MSSAQRENKEEKENGRLPQLLMYKIKRRGPRMEPCGAPEKTWVLEERVAATETCW